MPHAFKIKISVFQVNVLAKRQKDSLLGSAMNSIRH
jgi:hypothetical protein